MARESIFKKKERVRPPRVHITYEVETLGAIELKELPFVCGVLADLSGHPKEELPKLRDRKFIDIDRDKFDDVMAAMSPRLAIKVDNKLKDDGSKLSLELDFRSMDDFRPEAVAQQVDPMRQLLEVRGKLKDLLSRTEGNDRLEEMLEGIIADQSVRGRVQSALGGASGGDAEGSSTGAPASGGSDTPEEN